MNKRTRATKNMNSPRNRHNGRTNAFKLKVMKNGTGFEDSKGTHYAEATLKTKRVFDVYQNLPRYIPSVTRVKVG